MTLEEINELVSSIESKINEIRTVMSDMKSCSGERSKAILLAAASKLAEQFKNQTGK